MTYRITWRWYIQAISPLFRFTRCVRYYRVYQQKKDTFINGFFLRIPDRNCTSNNYISSKSDSFWMQCILPHLIWCLHPLIQSFKHREVKNTAIHFAAFIHASTHLWMVTIQLGVHLFFLKDCISGYGSPNEMGVTSTVFKNNPHS